MKATDYLIMEITKRGITDIFGYPGGVICHFIDSAAKNESICLHTLYHEQAAAFAACSYGQASGKTGIAYATSGPGATNLVTGIANAWFDSIPTIFFTGNVDTYQQRISPEMRQRGFQETNIVDIVRPITKYCASVQKAEDLPGILDQAFLASSSGRPGPVLIDLPADVQRAQIDVVANLSARRDEVQVTSPTGQSFVDVIRALNEAKRPVILAGAGVKQSGCASLFRETVGTLSIPVVTSLPALDLLPTEQSENFGFIGTNGKRAANLIVEKCDLLITVGSRLDLKQVGNQRARFAPGARLIRVDCDSTELELTVHDDEIQLQMDVGDFLSQLRRNSTEITNDRKKWFSTCQRIRSSLSGMDRKEPHEAIDAVQRFFPEGSSVTIDVGQHMLWAAQSIHVHPETSIFMSAGLGSMGYALPAAIGVFYALRRPVVAICGDGGVQMSIHELQYIAKEKIPVVVLIVNNAALGMIRQFQELNFERIYVHTTSCSGYSAPDFSKIAHAYGLNYRDVGIDPLRRAPSDSELPAIWEIKLLKDTYLEPAYGNKEYISNMIPLMDQDAYNELRNL